jgi:hypothetical protein
VKPVVPLQGNRLNANRIARMVVRPAVSILTDRIWDFCNSEALYMHMFPELAGQRIEGGVVGRSLVMQEVWGTRSKGSCSIGLLSLQGWKDDLQCDK